MAPLSIRIIVMAATVISLGSLAVAAEDFDVSEPQPLDGVVIEALETYASPKTHQMSFDLGVWPFNAYYTGFSLNMGYTYFFNKSIAWEVLNGSYFYTVDKNLTSQLAETYGVNPTQIERLTYGVSSNLIFFHSYGKFIFLKEYIRYFRSGFLLGPAFVASNKQGRIAADIGWRFETYASDVFSWKLEIRDAITFGGDVTNNVAFLLGTTYGF